MKHNVTIKPRQLELSIQDRKKVAEGTTEVIFDIESKNFTFKPGQYFRFTIPSLSLDVPKGNTRDFTIASSPNTKKTLSIAFRNSDSAFKKYILDAPVGAKVKAQGPLGVFTLPEDSTIPIVFIAGGIGATPVLSMMRFVSENNTGHNIHVIYANSGEERVAYIDEIKALAEKNSNIRLTEKIGRIDAEFIKKNIEYTDKTLWYLCGAPEMVSTINQELPDVLNISDLNIRIEEYVGYYNKNRVDYKVFSSTSDEIVERTKDEIYSDTSLIEPLLAAIGESSLFSITNLQGTIEYANEKFIQVAKYSKDELIGQNHRILKSGFHPPEYYIKLWKAVSSGKLWRGEIKNRAKDGSFYWVDTSISPIKGSDGKIEGYLAVRFLINDKKKLEKALRELEKAKTEADKINKFVVNRELKMIELKKEIEELKKENLPKS